MTGVDYTNFVLTEVSFSEKPYLRLDKLLTILIPDVSRQSLQILIAHKQVMVDNIICNRPAQKIKPHQKIAVNLNSLTAITEKDDSCQPECIPLNIVYEDEDIIVINKPAGMVVHPGHGNREGTIQAALLHHHPPTKKLIRAGLVHRLDKNTTGLMVSAKTANVQQHLINQFQKRTISREYLALVHGNPPATNIINRPIGKSRQTPIRMAITAQGKEAITLFSVEKRWAGFALLRCQLKTGRTHQIRAHLEYEKLPIIGDPIYCRGTRVIPFLKTDRQMLHATALRLIHPNNKKNYHWECPLPIDMKKAISIISEHQPQ